MTEAEQLQKIMQVEKSQNRENIDLQPFYLRNVLGTRLRAENAGRIPVLLYWHPNMDQCASVCKIDTIDPLTSGRSSIIGRIKCALGVADSVPKSDSAACKFLVSKNDTLEQVASNCMKNLQKLVFIHIEKLFNSQWYENWQQRHDEIQKKLPKWDAHDRQTVIAFFIPSGEHSLVVHPSSKWESIDKNYHGDDNLLRLYISFEFRRALRDRMIEQQRAAKQAMWQTQFEMQRKMALERQLAAQAEDKEAKAEAAAAAAARTEAAQKNNTTENEEASEKNNDDVWEYEQDVSSTMLKRAGSSIVSGAQSTGDFVVGGASFVVGGASAVVNSASQLGYASVGIASQSVGTLTSIFRR